MTNTKQAHESALRSLIAQQEDAWNRGDAAAWAAPFTDTARFIALRGDALEGKPAIEASHRMIFAGFYKGSHDQVSIEKLLFAAPGVAIIDVIHNVTNYATLPPGVAPTEPGVLRARMRFVAVLEGVVWRFIAAQNTGVIPRPATPPAIPPVAPVTQ